MISSWYVYASHVINKQTGRIASFDSATPNESNTGSGGLFTTI